MARRRKPFCVPPPRRALRIGLAVLAACVPAAADDPRGFLPPLAVSSIERTRIDVPLARSPAPSPSRWQPAPVPAATQSGNTWAMLLAQAATDDPVPACRLAMLLEDCRLAREVERMIDTELSMAVREGREAERAADDILALEASGAAAHRACGAAPPEVRAHEWNYLLRAALAGHAPSMHRFVTDLPVDAASPHEQEAALAAWRRHAPELLDALVRRHSREALVLAYRAAQGFAILGDRPLQARDPVAAARLGRALEIVLDDDPALAVELAALESELDPARHRRARREGERLADAVLSSTGHGTPADECDAGWPGMPATWTAYGHQPVD